MMRAWLTTVRPTSTISLQRLEGSCREPPHRGCSCSDGSQTLEVIVETGIARGYEYSAVTDHSYGLPIAHGVSIARLRETGRGGQAGLPTYVLSRFPCGAKWRHSARGWPAPLAHRAAAGLRDCAGAV
jgi:hypothetical protein